MKIEVISSVEEFESILENNSEFFLLKHSLTCPISGAANMQYEHFSEDATVPCYTLYVQESRPLANHIAEVFSIRHESPQVLHFSNGKIAWHESHGAITTQRLKEA
ncbi:bacillithiol system redox-active protein YtxJ [Halobacillus sp. H74]|uniref:bacillithiol system redox-active protein YtxJ n=1 Tax=Halobacillus sp. H74 TaxID=3457436 RepID=UPI003FCE8F19